MSSLESTKRAAEDTASSDQGESKKAAVGDNAPVPACPADATKVRAAATRPLFGNSKWWQGVVYWLGFPIYREIIVLVSGVASSFVCSQQTFSSPQNVTWFPYAAYPLPRPALSHA